MPKDNKIETWWAVGVWTKARGDREPQFKALGVLPTLEKAIALRNPGEVVRPAAARYLI